MRGVRSSPWPTLRRMPAARPPAKKKIALSPIAIGGRAPHRRAVRDRAGYQRQERRGARGDSTKAEPAVWSRISMPICVNRSFGFRAGTIWSRRSITFSSVGRAFTLFLDDGPCLPFQQCRRARPERDSSGKKNHGCSAGPDRGGDRAAANVQPHHHVQNEIVSIRRLGWLTSSPASPTTPRIAG